MPKAPKPIGRRPKLRESDVIWLRNSFDVSHKTAAAQLGVTYAVVYAARFGLTWHHLKWPVPWTSELTGEKGVKAGQERVVVKSVLTPLQIKQIEAQLAEPFVPLTAEELRAQDDLIARLRKEDEEKRAAKRRELILSFRNGFGGKPAVNPSIYNDIPQVVGDKEK